MTLDKLAEKLTIHFSRPVQKKETKEQLLVFLQRALPQSEITYHFEEDGRVGNRFEYEEQVRPKTYNVRGGGHIRANTESAAFTFLKKDALDSGKKFYGMLFDRLPASRVEELPPARVALIDDARTAVEQYFSTHTKPI